jgi:hypothetical protein
MRLRTTVSVGVAAAAALGVVLLFTWYVPRFHDAILPGLGSSRTTSMASVDITLRDVEPSVELQLRVLQAYIVRGRDRRGGTLESLRVETRLPELTPAPALPEIEGSSGSLEHANSLAAFNNGLTLTLGNEFIEPNWETGTTRANWLARFSADPSSGRAVAFELVNEDYSGLWFYRELSCPSTDNASRDASPTQAGECRDTYREHLSQQGRRETDGQDRLRCDASPDSDIPIGMYGPYELPRSSTHVRLSLQPAEPLERVRFRHSPIVGWLRAKRAAAMNFSAPLNQQRTTRS